MKGRLGAFLKMLKVSDGFVVNDTGCIAEIKDG